MGKIVKFPGPPRKAESPEISMPTLQTPQCTHWSIRMMWVIAVLCWPLLRKILGIDCFIQLLIAMYRWDDAPFRAGFTFTLHFFVLCTLTYFVTFYQPKGP